MDTVISFDLAQEVINQGGMPIYHRFCSIDQTQFCKKFKNNCFEYVVQTPMNLKN